MNRFNMWSIEGRVIVHQSGLSIEVTDGSFNNPMDLSIKGDKGLTAPELASMIREGINYAVENAVVARKKSTVSAEKKRNPKRPILKLKKNA
ncbi:hypothetical protein [Neptuniibacter caesariensis]|uniref:Uncharacterized protein n=1 Tax=Neptuniibacter caesariensis TaxID=207954 RepID=A0A7U8C2E9_NEPCE|nr:hypothetical protein [Neptuniibacter caesariensis]EAR60240.1 hypothetical protein MED92_17374 [Oceanospirillum sp. MED92] [Neptuniibacter caesariensis]